MKTLILISSLIILFACEKDDVTPITDASYCWECKKSIYITDTAHTKVYESSVKYDTISNALESDIYNYQIAYTYFDTINIKLPEINYVLIRRQEVFCVKIQNK